ncbi:MAG: hypothetical protein WC043_05640 [Pseudobdellovibrionaceae bacterium]
MAIPSQEDFTVFIGELEQLRDEVKLKWHLGSKDVQDEWHAAEEKWKHFSRDAALDESGKNVSAAFEKLGAELKAAYQRINKAL